MATPLPEDAAAYATFIQGIELQHIWLAHALVENRVGPFPPEHTHVKIADLTAERQTTEAGHAEDKLIVVQPYRVLFEGVEQELLAEITVVFGLEYTIAQPITDAWWKIFAARNVPLNAWPYLREFVASAVSRMGWANFTLPAFKVSAEHEAVSPPDDPPF